jgi:hypothetical protein
MGHNILESLLGGTRQQAVAAVVRVLD